MITYTQDANFVLKKWSTWLAIIAASSYSGSLFWERLPAAITGSLPDWIDSAMALLGLLATMAVPIATSIQQKSIPVVVPEPDYRVSSYYQSSNDEEMP